MSDEIDKGLEKLRLESASIRPSAAFHDRVMLAVATRQLTVPQRISGFWQVTSRLRFVGMAAVAAAAAIFVAFQSDVENDDLVAASYAATEVDW